MISLQGKTNFFEKRVGEYQKAGVMTGGAPAMFERLLRWAAFFLGMKSAIFFLQSGRIMFNDHVE